MHTDLNRMLDQYDERRRVDLERERQAKDDDVQFLASFAKLRSEVVRPVLEDAGALLAQRGHGFSIVEEEYGTDAAGKVREAGISLQIAPAGMPAQLHAEDHERTLSITTRHYNKTVWVSGGRALHSGGTAGAKGAYAIERIDRQLVEAEVVRLVGAVMGG